jgi:hypothetical protein
MVFLENKTDRFCYLKIKIHRHFAVHCCNNFLKVKFDTDQPLNSFSFSKLVDYGGSSGQFMFFLLFFFVLQV